MIGVEGLGNLAGSWLNIPILWALVGPLLGGPAHGQGGVLGQGARALSHRET